ncbi:MAG: trypsin-like peptidase domain-containing protein [Smithellaceae bacterium]
MTKCPSCGYERKEIDQIIDASQCPKCGIVYAKWRVGEIKPAPKVESALPPEPPAVGDKKRMERWLFAAAGLVVVIVLIHSLIVPLVRKSFQKKEMEVVAVEPQEVIFQEQRQQPVQQQVRRVIDDAQPRQTQARRELSIADIIRQTRSSVVLVQTPSGVGTGFFINAKGHIVTNKHVLPYSGDGSIKTSSGRVYKINGIVAEDHQADLVIASTLAPTGESIPVTLNTGLPEVGEKVIVIGNPLGLEQTVSDGIVSAIRVNQASVHFIQVTAPVSPGNSGGPLLNMRGEVIGVATFQIRQGQNLNFCVAAGRVNTLNGGMSPLVASSASGDFSRPDEKPVYCYADSSGKVSFVEWRTGLQVTRPDGSLDRGRFEKWVVEQIGGNPDNIDPEREARDDVERNRQTVFNRVFPQRSYPDDSLTPSEREYLERHYQRHYVEIYNSAVSRRNEAIRKYRFMMQQFDAYAATRN